MKEEYGMRLDDEFYMEAIDMFKDSFKKIFFNEMILEKEDYNFSKGNFKLIYHYIPTNYKILVENDIRTFTITIIDAENAKNSLYRITKFNNQLINKNIRNSIVLLRDVLKKNDFNLYLYVDKKLYRKNVSGLTRVKDIRELLNG